MAGGTISTPTPLAPVVANVDSNSASDQNTQSQIEIDNDANIVDLIGGVRVFGDSINSMDSRIGLLEKQVHSITSDYAILDGDGYGVIDVDSRTGKIVVTLPTAGANTDRDITIKSTHIGGKITIDGEGAETIDGDLEFILNGQYDFLSLYCDGTEWFIRSARQSCWSGIINTSDWTDRQLGSVNVAYDNLTGTYDEGERVIEYSDAGRTVPTGIEGVIQSDSGAVLILKDVVGGGNFTNDYYLEGETSGATSDVNGATKNVDSDMLHEFGLYQNDINVDLYYSETGVETDMRRVGPDLSIYNGPFFYGSSPITTDDDNISIQTGSSGIYIMDNTGTMDAIDSEDHYYNIRISRVI